MTTQRINPTRSLQWEDEAPAETRFRRMEQGVPPAGRVRPATAGKRGGLGISEEMTGPDADGPLLPIGERFGTGRFDGPGNPPRGPWWRPASTWGRVFLGMSALIVLGGLATGAFLLKTYIERDARFRIAGVGNIQATGLGEVSREDVLPVFGEDIGRNIFFVNLSDRRRQLEAIPWVQRATVMRLLPDQIRVAVVEREPVAFARQGQQFGLVDANGVLLTMPAAMMAQHHYSFPTLSGIDPRDPLPARKERMAVYQRLLAALDSNGQKLSTQISEVDLTDPEDARVTMQDDTTLLHFGDDRFQERYQRYKTHIAEWRQQYPNLAAVDLRYERQVVLEMTTGPNAAQATAGGEDSPDAGNGKTPSTEPAKKAQPARANPENHASGARPAKPAAKSTSKPKAPTIKEKAAKEKAAREKAAKEKAVKDKKRAAAQRAVLKASKRKPASRTRPAASEGE